MIISDSLDRTLGDKRHVVTVELAVHALMQESTTSCDVTFEEEVKAHLPADVREAVENGVASAYLQGNRNSYLKTFVTGSFITFIYTNIQKFRFRFIYYCIYCFLNKDRKDIYNVTKDFNFR